MSKPVTVWHNPHNIPIPAYKDPRIPIARHIDWIKTYTIESTFTSPEPDNYNRAVYALTPIECKFIKDQVFYRDLTKHNTWWTVYYVPQDQLENFDSWIKTQNYQLFWLMEKTVKLRSPMHLLYARKNSDITDNERLFQMGYYAKLGSKYFSEDDTMLLERLGPARAVVNGLEEV